MRLHRFQFSALLPSILTLAVSLLTNMATNQLPEWSKPYLWLTWPLFIVSVVISLALALRGERGEPDNSKPRFDVKSYYEALKKRYRNLDLDALTPPQKEEYLQLQLRSVFVEQNMRESPPPLELPKEVWERLQIGGDIHPDDLPEGVALVDLQQVRETYYGKPLRRVLAVLAEQQRQHVIILGDPGAGKSTLTRYLVLSLIEGAKDNSFSRAFHQYLPLLVELRVYIGLRAEKKCDTFLEYLEYLGKTEGWHLNREELDEYLRTDGRAVVIFDGLDEVFDPEEREQVTKQVVGFSLDYPKARIVVTSRVIGYRRALLTEAGFAHFTLQDLDQEQVAAFIQRWYELALSDRPAEAQARRERILRSFSESASIRQLAGNPMLLTIMAIIGKHQDLPRERWKLYDHAASVLIQHWDVKRHLESQRVVVDYIGEEEKKELLRRLAYRMQGGDGGLAGNYIYREQLQQEFESYLIERYNETPARAVTIARLMIEQFRARNFILSLYGANLYGFVHRAFLEYFCALAFVHKFEKDQELTIDQLCEQVFGAHWQDQSWHEVLRLICGMIGEKFAARVIEYLTVQAYPDWEEKFEQQPPTNIVLAVQCLNEVRNLNLLTEPAGQLLRAIVELFDYALDQGYSSAASSLFGQLLAAVNLIGPNWPQRASLAQLLRARGNYKRPAFYDEEFGQFIAVVAGGEPEVERALFEYAESDAPERRILAPYALTEGWGGDPKVIALAHRLAVNDPSTAVRRTTLRAIARNLSHDPRTVQLLKERMERETADDVVALALTELADIIAGDEQLLPLLRAWVIKDDYPELRRAAVQVLARHYKQAADIVTLLIDRAVNDSDENVRVFAFIYIGVFYKQHPGLFELLAARCVADPGRLVRYRIVNELADIFAKREETQAILRERAENDPATIVRDAAKELLIKLSGGSASTPAPVAKA